MAAASMSRYDATNLFHFSEDLITTFISLWLLQHAEPDAGGQVYCGTPSIKRH